MHRSAQESHLQQMASAGFGAILAPEHAPRLPSLTAIPIEGDPVRREVQLLAVAGRQYSPALDAFIKVARVRDWTSALDKLPRASAPASNNYLPGSGEHGAAEEIDGCLESHTRDRSRPFSLQTSTGGLGSPPSALWGVRRRARGGLHGGRGRREGCQDRIEHGGDRHHSADEGGPKPPVLV